MFNFLKGKVKAQIDTSENVKIESEEKNLNRKILNIFKINNINHEVTLPLRIAELKANSFTPKLLDFRIHKESDLREKVKDLLIYRNFTNKFWIINNIASLLGASGWLVFNSTTGLNFLPIRFLERNYDINEKLVRCIIAYDEYEYTNQKFRLQETYEIDFTEQNVKVKRSVYNISAKTNVAWTDKSNVNNHLEETITLSISYIPITPVPNVPNERSDCAYVYEKIKVLNLAYEYIPIDLILSAARVVINETTIGATDEEVEQLVIDWLLGHVLITDFTPEDVNFPIQIVQTASKGKDLTDTYDWLKADIYKETGIPIAAAIKGAQQGNLEIAGLNIETNTLIEQQLYMRMNSLNEFIKMLIMFDKDVLNSKTFDFKGDVDKLVIRTYLNLIRPIDKQIGDSENNGSTKSTKEE